MEERNGDTDVGNKLEDTTGEGEGGMNGGSGQWQYIHYHVKPTAGEQLHVTQGAQSATLMTSRGGVTGAGRLRREGIYV